MEIEFPNSPGIKVRVERGGKDPITGEAMSEKNVMFTWSEEVEAEDGTRVVRREVRTFAGPSSQ